MVWGLRRDPDAYATVRKIANAFGPIAGPRELYRLLAPVALTEDQEVAWMVMLDTHGMAKGVHEFARGARDRVTVDLTDALRVAVINGSRYLILAHNHPSGAAAPSDADASLTKAVGEGAAMLDMVLLDHVVLGLGELYSFREDRFHRVRGEDGSAVTVEALIGAAAA